MFLEDLMPVTELFSALAVPVIGFLGVYIAWKQWKTAAYRHRMDLFDKRFEIYEATIDFILSIRGGGQVSDKCLAVFKEKTLPVRFLFNDEVADYIAEIRSQALDAQTFSQEAEGMDAGPEKIETQRKSSEARKWLYHQLDEEELNKRFRKFLDLGR
ncbi:MAG: hypothetical protein MH219_13840 [Marinobacter sp.]|jgi:hypothetical protein|nr:hypothetical protein [Marinobacter sp.]